MLEKVLLRWVWYLRTYRDVLRQGQALFSAAEDVWPEGLEGVRGKHLDPFYSDENIPAFLLHLEEREKEMMQS